MPTRTPQPPMKKRPSGDKHAGEKKLSLVSFVIHSFNRLRGKPNTDYQDALAQRQHLETRNPWKAVEIVPDYRGCAASKSLKGQRYLCDEAPTLPLPGCTSPKCNCRYKHFSDRRTGPRRADELGIHVHMTEHHSRERRSTRGRRRDDG